MGYALPLAEVEAAAKLGLDKTAQVKAEPGPLDPAKLPLPKGIAPKAGHWVVNQGQVKEGLNGLTIDDNGGHYWLTSKEPLPDNFQLVIRGQVEFLQGKQQIYLSQKSFLRMVCVRFHTPATKDDIMERRGYLVQVSHDRTHLWREGSHQKTEVKGNTGKPFALVITKVGGDITVGLDDEVLLKAHDPNSLPGGQPFSVGGFLSRLHLAEVTVLKLDGPALAAPPASGLPVAGPKPVEPPKGPVLVEGVTKVFLPAPADDVVVGGGGRYLVLPAAAKKKLTVFDTTLGQVVKEISLADEVFHLAAGKERLVVLYPSARVMQSFSLLTLQKEHTDQLPASLTAHPIGHVCMGSDSAGPLFAYIPKEKRTLALDLKTLKTTEVIWSHWSPTNAYGPLAMRASPDGTVLLGWGGGWGGLEMAVVKDGKVTASPSKFEFSGGAFALTSADGKFIFTPWAVTDRQTQAQFKVPALQKAYLVPSHEPGFFLALPTANGQAPAFKQLGGKEVLNPVTSLVLYSDDRQALFTLPACEEVLEGNDLPFEKRVHYFPTTGVLVTLSTDKSYLVRRHIDFGKQLEQSGGDYLLAVSRPPLTTPGGQFSYRPGIFCKKGGLKVELQSGPKGMTVTPDGKISWSVPKDFAEPTASVLLTLADATGREVFHRLEIAVVTPNE
jgi:hypothetical protein